jgi:hypothetical protein|tara:strand:+ start:343 stop:558 length:216 start_codon:yes stop_codon:yes gene_type:complete
MNIEILGWVATILLLIGYYLNANKQISSWAFWFVGNATMFVYALLITSYSIACLSIFLMGLNIYGYVSWKK